MSETITIVQNQSKAHNRRVIKMLTEERYSVIIEQVKQKKSVTLTELCKLLEASESTVRRDLHRLMKKGL